MKQFLSLALGSTVLVLSCHKSVNDHPLQPEKISTTEQQAPLPKELKAQCDVGPDYGDSIVYQQPTTGTDYFISPVNNPGDGHYLSWPDGLSIDTSNGTIDISKSVTGQRYLIGFIKAGTSDTCVGQLIISGTSYIDSVYDLTVSHLSAPPYYNANPNVPSPCAGPGCKFISPYKYFGKDLNVNEHTGIIDLQKTCINGIFGLAPFNGETVTTTINYTINDGSNNAQQMLQIRFVYFNSGADIPADLRNEVEQSRASVISNDAGKAVANIRPPLIIVTRNH
jgi:hypothetical protein